MRVPIMIVFATACGGSQATKPSATLEHRAEGSAASTPAPDDEQAKRKRAEAEVAVAVAEAEAARAKVDALMLEVEALYIEVDAAVDAVASAQNHADRQAAATKLKALQKEHAELKARVADAKSQAEAAELSKSVSLSNMCLDNPLAKGCE